MDVYYLLLLAFAVLSIHWRKELTLSVCLSIFGWEGKGNKRFNCCLSSVDYVDVDMYVSGYQYRK